jgi:hypothetical protein
MGWIYRHAALLSQSQMAARDSAMAARDSTMTVPANRLLTDAEIEARYGRAYLVRYRYELNELHARQVALPTPWNKR